MINIKFMDPSMVINNLSARHQFNSVTSVIFKHLLLVFVLLLSSYTWSEDPVVSDLTVDIQGAPVLARGDFDVDILFNENVTDFIVDDISVTNATLSGFSGSANSYSVTVSPINLGADVTLSIAAGVAQNVAENTNIASSILTVKTNNTGKVNVIGNPIEKQVLIGGAIDADGTTGATFTYQWLSGSSKVGSNSSIYTIQASDIGKAISLNITYTDAAGQFEDVTSIPTTAVISIDAATSQQEPLSKIAETANNSGSTVLTVADYTAAGVTGVNSKILKIVNIAIARAVSSSLVNELSEIQALVDVVLEGQDNDHDGLPNLIEGSVDSDGDGIADRNDSDDDNDGIPTILEIQLSTIDSDNDGIIDALDADVGNDGVVDIGKFDSNRDGVNDALDTLFRLTSALSETDIDEDGSANHIDLDSDNDGVADVVEAGLGDIDENALLDEGSAVIAVIDDLPDTDADGIPDYLELKSDDTSFDMLVYGLPVELLDLNNDGKLDSTIDMDNDGLMDVVDSAVGAWGSLPDVDGDGIANHVDRDDDNDGILDEDENSQFEHFTGKDADADGIDDGVDYEVNGVIVGLDEDGNGVQDDKEQSDLDGDGIADYLDDDSDNDGIHDKVDVSVNIDIDAEHKQGVGAVSLPLMLAFFGILCLRSRKLFFVLPLLFFSLSLQALESTQDETAPASDSSSGSWQVGGGLGLSYFDVELAAGLKETDTESETFQLSGGYQFDENWLLELRYVNLGKVEINNAANISYETFSLNVQYTLPWQLEDYETSHYYILLGAHSLTKDESGDGLNIDSDGTELHLGAGVNITLTKGWQLSLELSSYNESIVTGLFGIRYNFVD